MENNVCIERYCALEGKIRDDNTETVDRRVGFKKKKRKKKIRDAAGMTKTMMLDIVVAKGGRDRFGGEGRLNGTRGQCLENRRGAGHQLVQMHRIEV